MVRPQNAPNLSADLNFALQLEAQKQAADIELSARAAAALRGYAAGFNAMQPPAPTTKTYIMPGGRMMNCSTAGTVTTCF